MEKAKIGDFCDILNGFAFKSTEYVNSGIRIIRIANVQKGYIEDNAPAFYPNTHDLKKYMLEEGDLLLSLTGNVGRVATLSREFLPAALNQRVACLRLRNNMILKKYLFYVLNSNRFERNCIESANGIAQKNMSTEWLKEYEIPIYSIEKQKEIIEILDRISSILRKEEEQSQLYDELVKSRFVEMFGELEKTVRLGDCCEIHARIGWQALTKDEHRKTGDYMLITGTDLKMAALTIHPVCM